MEKMRHMRFSQTMKIHVVVFLDMTPCSDMVGYKRFVGRAVSIFRVKRCFPTTSLHGLITQKTTT